MNVRLASRAALAVALGIVVAPIGASAGSLQAAILAKLHSVNDKLGYKLFRRAAVHGREIDYYVDRSKFEGLGEDDRRRVIEVAEDVAAGEWHLRSPIPNGGLTVNVDDEFGQRLGSAEHVIFQPMSGDGDAVK